MTPRNPDFASVVRQTFAAQAAMTTLGAKLVHIAPGETDIELPFAPEFGQQDGFFHAGIITTVVDTACGCAALTLMPAGARVLTVEYKVNFLSPALGQLMVCQGRVKRPGRTLTVCQGEVVAQDGTAAKVVATMLTTMITVMPD